jgi:hypothetical protein
MLVVVRFHFAGVVLVIVGAVLASMPVLMVRRIGTVAMLVGMRVLMLMAVLMRVFVAMRDAVMRVLMGVGVLMRMVVLMRMFVLAFHSFPTLQSEY